MTHIRTCQLRTYIDGLYKAPQKWVNYLAIYMFQRFRELSQHYLIVWFFIRANFCYCLSCLQKLMTLKVLTSKEVRKSDSKIKIHFICQYILYNLAQLWWNKVEMQGKFCYKFRHVVCKGWRERKKKRLKNE